MARPAVQSKEWDYTVEQQQIEHKGIKQPWYGNFRIGQNGQPDKCLGIATEKYGIIQNRDLINATKAALDHHGLKGYEEKIVVIGEGERMYATYTFANKHLASGVGDVFGYKLTVKNSFDRSLRASMTLGFLRLVCTNGMASLEKDFSLTRKHNTKIAVNFIDEALTNAIGNGSNALKVFDEMAGVKVTTEQGKNVLAHLVEDGTLTDKVREEVEIFWQGPKRKEDEARNLYNLYNAITDYLTHCVETDRYEYASKTNNNCLLALANLARKRDKFKEYVKAIPVAAAPVVSVVPPAAS